MSSLWCCCGWSTGPTKALFAQHWPGGGDIVALADSIANIAPKFLPKRVSRVITSTVELAPAGEILKGITNNRDQAARPRDTYEIEPLEMPSATGRPAKSFVSSRRTTDTSGFPGSLLTLYLK